MRPDPKRLRDKSPKEILRELIQEVTKSEEEFSEKETRGGRTPDLKIFLADNREFSVGEIDDRIVDLTVSGRVSGYAKTFFDNHVIKEEVLDDDISFVEIVSTDVNRTSEFVFITQHGYLWVLTTELREWTKKTIERLLDYLPSVERLYLSSEDLEEITSQIDGSTISGFTANYHSPTRDRDATLRFHGAEEGDMAKAKEVFGAKPSRIEFDQENSPQAVVQGSQSNDGIVTFESVKVGSESFAVETAETILGEYEHRDFNNYQIENKPTRRQFEDYLLIDGFTCIELFDPDREEFENLNLEIEENILSSNQYGFGKWDEDTFFVHDREHGEIFELGIEGPNLVIHARESTTALSLRSFCKKILDDFDSTYHLRKRSVNISGAG